MIGTKLTDKANLWKSSEIWSFKINEELVYIENISSERVPLYCGTLIPWQRQKLHLGTYYNYTVLVHLLSTYMIYSAYIHNMYLGLSVVYVHIYKWTMNAH